MARTIPSEKRRIKQVKVNLSVSELNELDKYVAEMVLTGQQFLEIVLNNFLN